MNTVAIASQTAQTVEDTPARHDAPAIQVIAGGMSCGRRPRHARAEAAPTAAACARAMSRLDRLQGMPYSLSTRERALAAAGGILFAFVALACAVL